MRSNNKHSAYTVYATMDMLADIYIYIYFNLAKSVILLHIRTASLHFWKCFLRLEQSSIKGMVSQDFKRLIFHQGPSNPPWALSSDSRVSLKVKFAKLLKLLNSSSVSRTQAAKCLEEYLHRMDDID
jgi:hypothetical protein